MLVSVHRYSSASPWNYTDQIGISGSMWQRLYPDWIVRDGKPVFVRVGGIVVGRVRPEPALTWEPGRIDVPEWMWLLLGAPDTGAVLDLEVELELHDVGHLVLRPRGDLALEDPVVTLTAELSSGRWAVLLNGMELVLDCGVFDVVGLRDIVGEEVLAGCILDQDVSVEFAPAPAPAPAPAQISGMSFPGMNILSSSTHRSGYTPFGGQGHRLT